MDHFDFEVPKEKYYYNNNVYMCTKKGYIKTCEPLTSTLAVNKELLIEHLEGTIKSIESGWKAQRTEPGLADFINSERKVVFFRSNNPVLDIRHGMNFTGDRTAKRYNARYLKNIPYWGNFLKLRNKMGLEV